MPCWVLPADPCTISMQTSRVFGTAAVRASSVRAGTMASSSGSDTAAPMPRSTVRRETALRVRYIVGSPATAARAAARRGRTGGRRRHQRGGGLVGLPHLERHARDDAHEEARKPVVVRGGIADDRPHRRHVARVEQTAEAITEEVLGEGRDEGVGVGQHGAARRLTGPSSGVPSNSCPDGSTAAPLSVLRHTPTALKFSSASPMGSIMLWQAAQAALARCLASRSRTGRGLLVLDVLLERRHVGRAAAAGPRPSALPSRTCRAAPARCASPARSASARWRARAGRGGWDR